jgi:hypothetical protein
MRNPAVERARVNSANTTITGALFLVPGSVVYLAWQSGQTRYGLNPCRGNKFPPLISLPQTGHLMKPVILSRPDNWMTNKSYQAEIGCKVFYITNDLARNNYAA